MPKRPSDQTKDAAADWTSQVAERLRWVVEILQEFRPELSQSALAKKFNADQSTWNKYLQGTRLPSISSMTRFCDKYGLTLDYLYRGRLDVAMNQKLAIHLAARHPELVSGEASASEEELDPKVKMEA